MKGTLTVRKTIVLGLGSTGMQVCEQLAEHLTWQFGGMDRVGWVRMLVLETAQPQSPLGDRILWAGMTREEYLPYLNSPRTTGADFGFDEWQDGPTLRDIDNPSDGAGNCRMLGRLCLFHPRTYDAVRRRVLDDLSSLSSLTQQQIADRLGEPGLTVRIDEGGTVVIVVGTLCGGTGSGGCADLGYLIDVWSNSAVRRQAIFTLPHPTLQTSLAARYKKNAFFALKELNHYQLADSRWAQMLPGSTSPFVITGRPYDILRVVMPSGGTGADVRSLNATIAQYLAAAVGPAGMEIAASDVDAASQMAGAEQIGFMRPLFSTFGVAALEFPGEHVQRAATSRLLAGAYQHWAAHSLDEISVRRALEGLGAGDFDNFLRRIQTGSEPVGLTPFQDLLRGVPEGKFPRVEDLRALLRSVEARLTAAEPTGTDPALVGVIRDNKRRILDSLSADVDRFIGDHLLSREGGPAFISAVLRRLEHEIEAWGSAAGTAGPASRQDADTYRSMLDRALDDAEKLQNSPLVWNKKDRLKEAWQGISQNLYPYLQAEMKTQAVGHLDRAAALRDLLDQIRQVNAPRLRRLDQIQAAFTQEGAEHEKRWRELAAASPSINGKVTFEPEPPQPRGTVTEEYFRLLSMRRWPEEPAAGWDETRKEEAAQSATLQRLEGLRAELRREPGTGAFDPRPGIATARQAIPADCLRMAEEEARAFFAPLRDHLHIADRATESDIDSVVLASEPRLGVAAAQVSEQLAGAKGAQPLLSYLAFMDRDEGESRPSIQRVEQRVRNAMPLRRGGLTDSDDPYRLLIVREKHGFTLGQMEGVVRRNAYDNHSLQAAESCQDFKFWHTRRDVDWVDPLTPPAEVESTEEAWALALVLGRQAEPGLPWLPASSGEIPATGWYQLVSGEFYVYFADGVDAAERGGALPLNFNTAVAKLLLPDNALLRRTLTVRFASYLDRAGADRLVRAVDQALRALSAFGVDQLDGRRAEQIVRRAYRRNDLLTRAFFDFRTEKLTNPAEFAHLWRLQGAQIEGRNEAYASNGYYCPTCHYLLGGEIAKLLEEQFLCQRCNSGQRYWP